MKYTTQSGFIMVMALLMIALATMMTSIMFNRGGSYVPYMKAVADRQKAQMIALGGLALVQGYLSQAVQGEQSKETQGDKKAKAPSPDQNMHHFLKIILPVLNEWQQFELTEQFDGVDGELSFYLASEDGKINLNKVFDFKEKKFVGEQKKDATQESKEKNPQAIKAHIRGIDWKKQLAFLFERIEKETKTKELLPALEEFLKKRDYPLNDITELLTIKQFEPLKNEVYLRSEVKENMAARQRYALTDLFTLLSDAPTIEPWLLSNSMIGILGMHRASSNSVKGKIDSMATIVENSKVKAEWPRDWDATLKHVYGIDANAITKEVFAFFNTTYKARYFSAFIVGTVGDAVQQLYAILERIEKSQDTKTVYDVKIRRFYWV